MCPVTYLTMTHSKNQCFDLRFHLVQHALPHGIRQAADAYQTSRNTVRKWLRRYQENGSAGLKEESRAPHSCPHQTSVTDEQQVLEQRARAPGFGARRLKREFGLKPSIGAIARILRKPGLTRRKKRTYQTKRDQRAVKAKYAPLTHLQMDVKYLNDIPHYWPQMQALDLPRFQYTIRCVKTGAVFLAYGSEVSVTYAELTIRRFLEHLELYGIGGATVVVQTDSGSEFAGQAMRKTDRGFNYTVEQHFKAQHRRICGNPNADVESSHAHEEPEFFHIETFASPADFWQKITTYRHYWNLGRNNSYKGDRTPLRILQEAAPQLPPEILLLAPLNLDTFVEEQLGHDVPVVPGVSFFPAVRCSKILVGMASRCNAVNHEAAALPIQNASDPPL